MIIREATVEDSRGMARVRVDTWKTSYRGFIASDHLDSLSDADSETRFRQSMTVPGTDERFFVADEGGDITGFVIFGPERAVAALDRGEIYALYVRPEKQGTGTGRALFRAAASSLLEAGMRSLLVWTLENGPSAGFYEHFGGTSACLKNVEIGNESYSHMAYCWSDYRAIISLCNNKNMKI